MDEYQLWCEEASATIARVGKFSLECRSTEAVSVLYRQFEKFVWPTVPQQEERISQITELAIRLHGVEEGQRYIEKTVSKHSEMVESIRELSNGLMELEAKLKLESLKQQQFDEDKEVEEEGEREHRRQTEEQEKIKEKRRMKQKKQRDNRSTQEAADMHELKETGHTPELITEKDRKKAAAANREPPLEKTQSHGVNGPKASRELQSGKFTSSFTSTHTLTICSPVDVKRQVQATPNQSQTVATEPQATPSQSIIGPSFPDNQEEFHSEMEGTELQMDSGFCRSNTNLLKETSPHVEIHQPEVMTEDFLSNDEYDCASPDDISLPPLAETPESNMFLSDVEEGFCFSSHSVHISQASHQFHAQSEPTGTGPLPQQKESGQTESCPPSTVSLHSCTRFRSESRSFMPSPSTVPVATPFTSTLSTILKTKDSSTVLSLDNSVHGYNTIDCSKDRNGLKKRSPSKTPTQDVSQTLCPQSFNGSDTVLHNYNSPKGDTGVRTFRPSYTRTDCILPEKRDLQSIFNQSFSSGRSQTDTTSNKDARDPPVNLTHSPPQPTSINNIGICCSKQSLQTVYPLQEFLIFNHTQQFVHGPSMSHSLAQPAPPHPDPQNHASPHPANLHGTSLYSPLHVLTPTQDPDICLPVAIREEIRLTPQIQGPHLLQPSSESLPLEKASEPGLPCFTRPLSQAIIMEGSPVTLEVEVMGKPEPRLTRGSSCRVTHEEVSPCYMDQNRDQEQACALQDSQRLAGSSSSVGDNWLVLEVFDIIMEDWSTWFGTLCPAVAALADFTLTPRLSFSELFISAQCIWY
ncbi:hypothetical protein CHARACLAT_012806 [Characodon lateralis]|uniref:Uncharacterized protein n=1 Tax=Characodon lateralis TaxID=208331 RepID=A0ABU7D6X2_9TELE|nr:hypothetical protein [Characodon lateralis]